MRHYFKITHYDPARPWIAVSIEARTVELADSESPHEWAAEHYPDPNVRAVKQPGPPPD